MPTQRETLNVYTALMDREPQWQGKLILSVGMDRTLALAALAAGAATLILEEDAALLKDARQDVTFTVTTLDEALRALKNEIRQGRAITVALAGDRERWLRAMDARGVQPHLIADPLVMGADVCAVGEDVASTLQERRLRDASLMEQYPLQRRWLEAAPSLFPRDLTRAYLLEDERLKPLP